MIRLNFLVFVGLLACFLPGEQADPLGELGEGLDLSVLDKTPPAPESESEVPARHLFFAFDQAPKVDAPEAEEGLVRLRLPRAPYLVAPNAARVDTAYRNLGKVANSLNLKPRFPLKLVLHADGNVSVGCALEEDPETALPPGIDISPRPALPLAGIWADVQVADKTHPQVLAAVVALRRHAAEADLDLDTSELYFLPAAPGKVLVALRIK